MNLSLLSFGIGLVLLYPTRPPPSGQYRLVYLTDKTPVLGELEKLIYILRGATRSTPDSESGSKLEEVGVSTHDDDTEEREGSRRDP